MQVSMKELIPFLKDKYLKGSAEITVIKRLQVLHNHKSSDDVWKKEPSNSGLSVDEELCTSFGVFFLFHPSSAVLLVIKYSYKIMQ